MASIQYVTRLNESNVVTLYRQVIDGDTIIAEARAPMEEVRNVDGAALDNYFETVADRLEVAIIALRDANNRPDLTTYSACGQAYMDLQQLISEFDKTVLPPSNVL